MTRRSIIGRADRSESGVALVEFAFVLVLFVMLIWGIISFGYAWSLKEQMYHAAQEGLRQALVTPSASSTDDTPKQAAALDTAHQRLQAMLGTESNEPATHIETGNCTGGTTCTGTPVYAECPTSTTGTEPNTKCMTLTLTYDWKDHPKIAPLPGIFNFLPGSIHVSATGKVQ